MCIVVYKPENTEFPSWNTLKTCFEHNPDGAGFMWADGKSVHIRKGFMNWGEFKKALKPYKAGMDKYPFVMHFRIATHGGTNPAMTHPFPLSANTERLKATSIDTNVGIAHNGIISMCSGAKSLSDTAEFIKKYLTLLIRSPKYYANHKICDIIEELIGSKMCILSEDMHAEVLGHGWIVEDGISYSNESFQSYHVRKKSRYGGYYGGYDSSITSGYDSGYYDICDMCGIEILGGNMTMYDGYCLCDECYDSLKSMDIGAKSQCGYARTKDWDECNKCELNECIYWG